MAGFSINIFDQQDLNAATEFELAKKGSIQKIWQGKDDKMLNMIGSSITFTMMAEGSTQGKFSHLYTYDERRYLVTQNDADTGDLIWQGYLLPEQYEEPYTNGNVFIKLAATDGLGALKNQLLNDDDYDQEMPISQVVAKCLQLTGIQANINVTPAIINFTRKRWDQQIIDTGKFIDQKGKKDSAYDILSSILSDTLCCIFQDSGQWFIYGINKRPLISGSYWQFDFLGNYIDDVSYEKNIKSPRYYGRPVVGINTPKRLIRASHKLISNVIETETYKVKNPGFVLTSPVDLINYKWAFTKIDFVARYNSTNGRVFISPVGDSYDATTYVELRRQLLLIQGEKVQWDFEFQSGYSGTETWGNDVETLVVDGLWDKILVYDIFYTDPVNGSEIVLFSNQNGPSASDERYQVKFDRDRKASLTIQMTAPETAYYNIRFYRPVNLGGDIKTDKIYFDKLELSAIAASDEKLYESIIPETYTQGIELELDHHDDLKDLENAIRLQELGPTGEVYYTLTGANVVTIERDGKFYIQGSLNLILGIDEHRETVFVGGVNIRILDVFFDFPSSGQYLAEYDPDSYGGEIPSGTLGIQVQCRKYADIPSDVSQWVQWADAVYQNEFKRYGDAVVEVIRNLYQTPHPKITAQVDGLITMRDLLFFNYQGEKVFFPTDIQQNLDQNKTVLKMSQNMYGQAVTDNLPPVVDAGPDLNIPEGGSDISLAAVASDPDGVIVGVLWELVSGSGTPVIVDPDQLSTNVTGLTGDQYVFRVTVTDDSGLTASDDVVISRAFIHELVPTIQVDSTNMDDPNQVVNYKYTNLRIKYDWVPSLPENTRLRIRFEGIVVHESPVTAIAGRPSGGFTISEGTVGSQFSTDRRIGSANDPGNYVFNYEMQPGKYFVVGLFVQARNTSVFGPSSLPLEPGDVRALVQVDFSVEVITGSAALVGVPVQLTVEAIH